MARSERDAPRLTVGGRPCGQSAGLGSFAERMLVHENAVARIPADVPLASAALIGCAVLTGVGAVFHTARVEPGSTVAVVGCGGVGLNCVQGARLAGAARVVGVDTNPSRLEAARALGATDVVDASRDDPVGAVRALVRRGASSGVDYAFEVIGTAATVQQAFAMLAKGGLATVIGILPPGTTIGLDGAALTLERRIQGSVMGSNRFAQDVPTLIELYRQGRLKLDELVTSKISLDQVNDGFDMMDQGTGTRSVIVFDGG
jgi:S-(hydroxymethyl)glutathione dehydrogenase/alcohol dehydrogenase